jgi:hypothetical protein
VEFKQEKIPRESKRIEINNAGDEKEFGSV